MTDESEILKIAARVRRIKQENDELWSKILRENPGLEERYRIEAENLFKNFVKMLREEVPAEDYDLLDQKLEDLLGYHEPAIIGVVKAKIEESPELHIRAFDEVEAEGLADPDDELFGSNKWIYHKDTDYKKVHDYVISMHEASKEGE